MKHELNTTILVTRAPISNFIGRCLQFGLLGELYRIVNYSRVEFFFFFFFWINLRLSLFKNFFLFPTLFVITCFLPSSARSCVSKTFDFNLQSVKILHFQQLFEQNREMARSHPVETSYRINASKALLSLPSVAATIMIC